jgi:hypothetical protein
VLVAQDACTFTCSGISAHTARSMVGQVRRDTLKQLHQVVEGCQVSGTCTPLLSCQGGMVVMQASCGAGQANRWYS